MFPKVIFQQMSVEEFVCTYSIVRSSFWFTTKGVLLSSFLCLHFLHLVIQTCNNKQQQTGLEPNISGRTSTVSPMALSSTTARISSDDFTAWAWILTTRISKQTIVYKGNTGNNMYIQFDSTSRIYLEKTLDHEEKYYIILYYIILYYIILYYI